MMSALCRAGTIATALAFVALAHPAGAAPAAGTLEVEHKTLTNSKGVKIEADDGVLWVPENRGAKASRAIRLEFLRLESTASAPRAPLFYLEGGPGTRGINRSPRALDFWTPLLAVGDVVLINQRGTNDSLLTWSWDGPPPTSFFVSADSASAHVARMQRRAGQAFRERGVDLAGYTTVESADDLDALRSALAIEKVSVLGFSYGTHLGTSFLRRHGAHVEDAILIGTEGPDETFKLPWTMDVQFQKLALLAAKDPALQGKVPDLLALYDRVVARLAREPMIVTLPSPAGGDSLRVPIGPFGLRYILRIDVGDATDLVVFPRLLWSIDQGDPSVLAWFVRKRAGGALGVHGMAQTMDDASGASPARRALVAEQAKTSRFADVIDGVPAAAGPPAWPISDLGEEYRAPLVSDVRTLFITGEWDFNTPPYQAERVRWGMPNSTHLIVPNAGHEQVFYQNDDVVPILADFLRGEDVHGRAIRYPPLRFVPLTGNGGPAKHPSVSD
jgi:pimeloyl-ACP methyl ester carboxylesterase